MTQDPINLNHYIADEGKVLINSDGVYGTEIWLGIRDDISNWQEIEYTGEEEEYG